MTRSVPVTVAIATLDRPDGLARCLDELLAGDALPAEVIVVDQGWGDATPAVVEERRASAVPITYIRQERRGLAASRNAAVARAGCSVVAVTDDDCVPDRNWVATIGHAFAAPDAPDALCGRVLPLGPDVPGLYPVSLRTSAVRAEYRGKAVPWVVGTGGDFAAARAWFARVGGYDERLGAGSPGKAAEDIDLLYRLLRAGGRVRYEPDAVIYHERQDAARRLASRSTYGHGIGAFCGKWLRRSDPYALLMCGSWLRLQGWELAAAIRRRRRRQVYERLAGLQGTARGLVYGLRTGQEGGTMFRGGDDYTSGVTLRKRLRRLYRPAWLGTLRRTTPLSHKWGYDRGTPVDRYYIERFLDAHRADIHGRVLEVKDSGYTDRFGQGVERRDVLDIDGANPRATVIADLTAADAIPSDSFDCFVLTQTLHLIFDTRAALVHARRILRPGGVLLVTVPAMSRTEPRIDDYWRFTGASSLALFGSAFGAEHVTVQTYGNVLACIASLAGMASEELSRRELDAHDERFPFLIGIRAVKG